MGPVYRSKRFQETSQVNSSSFGSSDKSDLIRAQQFTFIGMEFLTQQTKVRVPVPQVDYLILTIKIFLSQTQVLA